MEFVVVAIAIHEQYPWRIFLTTMLLTVVPNLLLWVLLVYAPDVLFKKRHSALRVLALMFCLAANCLLYGRIYSRMPFDVDTADHMEIVVLPIWETVVILPLLLSVLLLYFVGRMIRGQRR